jgi:hypothetical protein
VLNKFVAMSENKMGNPIQSSKDIYRVLHSGRLLSTTRMKKLAQNTVAYFTL